MTNKNIVYFISTIWTLLFVNSTVLAKDKHITSDEIRFTKTTTWVVDNLTLENGATIITNGNNFTLIVRKNLVLNGYAKILSFPEAALDSFPTAPTSFESNTGSQGASFNPGPGTSGRRPARAGGPGEKGESGIDGRTGRSAQPIVITVLGDATGKLIVRNEGENGQPGGNAGNGGSGGTGEQGGRGKTKKDLGIVTGCRSGPSHGGNGGKGGNGGTGGNGGNGGNGGDIHIEVSNPSEIFKNNLIVSSIGGQGAAPGKGGEGGAGGAPGFGGRGSAGCEGRETERRGNPGQPGSKGTVGNKGLQGQNGVITNIVQ